MTVKTFQQGVFLPHYKEYSEDKPIVTVPLPKEVVIPMQQHIGAPCSPIVQVGDEVRVGQLIGEPGGFVSAPVHSSVDGTVIAVEPRPHFNGTNVMGVVIEVADEQSDPGWQERDIWALSVDEIKEAIKDAGIVGMGGQHFLHTSN